MENYFVFGLGHLKEISSNGKYYQYYYMVKNFFYVNKLFREGEMLKTGRLLSYIQRQSLLRSPEERGTPPEEEGCL